MSKALLIVLIAVTLLGSGLLWANRAVGPLPAGVVVDRVVLEKSQRRLSLYSHGQLIRSYMVSLGRTPVGPKDRDGDHRTPEGTYTIDRHNPSSAFHLALHVSYPSNQDTARAKAAGYSPGGDIMIHGMRNGLGWLGRTHLIADWTSGCIAVTDAEMDELYKAVPDGTSIQINP